MIVLIDGDMIVLIDGINYELDPTTRTASVCVLDDYKKYEGDIVIPATVTYGGTSYCVTSIQENLLYDVVGAFYHCNGLTSIAIPNSITSIGECLFNGCSSLTSITIPDSVASIGDGAFSDCSSLTSITIPDSVTSIGVWAFSGCKSLTSITIPESVMSIGYCIFRNCKSLTSITISKSVTSIGYCAFSGCSSLTSITIPDNVTSIGAYAFFFCSGLTSITIPNNVTQIYGKAFKDCNNLQTIRVPKGKQSIFDRDDLEELQDKFVEYISAQIDGVQYELDDNLTAIVCAGEESYKGSIVIPARVEQEGKKYTINRLAARAFADCEELTVVTLPKSITEIGVEVFANCENLQIIRVPQGMTEQFCEMGLEPWRDKIVEPRQEEYTILLNIARGYEQGIGMPRNPAQAVLLYSQAADKGCAEAAYHLGELYEEGKFPRK